MLPPLSSFAKGAPEWRPVDPALPSTYKAVHAFLLRSVSTSDCTVEDAIRRATEKVLGPGTASPKKARAFYLDVLLKFARPVSTVVAVDASASAVVAIDGGEGADDFELARPGSAALAVDDGESGRGADSDAGDGGPAPQFRKADAGRALQDVGRVGLKRRRAPA